MAANSITYNNNNFWTAPNNDIIQVKLVGGGGGGGSTDSATASGGGGSGGIVTVSNVQVTAGVQYTIVVGAGGARGSGNANGSNGGISYFKRTTGNNDDGMNLKANGGAGGMRNSFSSSINYINTDGDLLFGPGRANNGNNANNSGGGGGSSGGNSANGRNGQGIVGGGNGTDSANLPAGAGAGGNGGAANSNGLNGVYPGGGGGGSGNNAGGTAKVGGNGAIGQVILSFRDNATVSGKVTTAGANQEGAKVIVMASDDNNANNSFVVGVATADAQGNWTMTVPSARVISAVAQHNNATAQYTSKATPFVAS